MSDKPLHIISFDNPYPPVYGGVIDVFYKLKALHRLGYDIYLHCFVDADIEPADELKELVKEVFFYHRNKKQSAHKLLSRFPFAVYSRYDKDLYANVKRIEAPVLFEGQQTTFLVRRHDFPDRKLVLRLHNLEANYFLGQSRSETHPAKKAAYFSEYLKYKAYTKDLAKFDAVFALSHAENDFVQKRFGNSSYVPVFHGNETVAPLSGFGKYAFYHGDLRLADNLRAVKFLIGVFRKIPDYNLVIASGCNAALVKRLIGKTENISYEKIENQHRLTQLLGDAHINVMLSFQESGTKLKLVNALYKSRFCVINGNMVDDKELRDLCTMAETEAEFIDAVNILKDQPYGDAQKRQEVLSQILDDLDNARKIQAVLESQPKIP